MTDDPRLEDLEALAAATPPGCFVEVGVYVGYTATRLLEVAGRQARELHLFDTFAGHPWSDPELDGLSHPVGRFADVKLEDVARRLRGSYIHVGVFPETLKSVRLPPIAFVHEDCDVYRSVHACISELWPSVVPGGVMLFDDSDLAGCWRAIAEEFDTATLRRTRSGKHYVVKGL